MGRIGICAKDVFQTVVTGPPYSLLTLSCQYSSHGEWWSVCLSLPRPLNLAKKKKKMIGQNKRVISSSAYSKMLGSKEALENIYLNEWIKYVKIICTGKTIRSQYKYSKMLIVLNYCRDVMGDYFLYFFKFLNFMFYILKIICFSSKEWTVLIS